MKKAQKYEIHLVSHTHWDREWYDTFENFRVRLVKLIDKLLAIMESDRNFRYFVLDGQTIVLEDYLQIKPQNRELLRRYIKSGRILVGPWYVLPDEFLESGESIVRNLLLGHKIAKEFGRVMKVGYVPDPFGHISQLPQILRGFNIDSFIFTRGMTSRGEELGSEFYWLAPEGSKVLAVRQVAWYGDSAELGKEPVDFEKALEVINRSKGSLSRCARTKYLLSNNGEDHREPQPEIPRIIKYLNQHLDGAVVIHSNFEKFVEKIKKSNPQLNIFEGELRGAKYAPLLPGVISSRMYLKQANERTQTKLEKIAEPIATMVWLKGYPYPKEILWQAWKYLLQSHPHDSICGCSIDEVHRDVMQRFAFSQQISDKLIDESIGYLSDMVDTDLDDPDSTPIIVLNTLNWQRDDIVRATLFYPKESQLPDSLTILSQSGERIPVQIQEVRESRHNGFREMDIIFLARQVPPYGYRVYSLGSGKTEEKHVLLKAEENAIENEYYRVEAKENGTLKIKDKFSGLVLDNVLLFEDTEDAGDEYNFSPAKNTKKITTEHEKAKISIEEKGPIAVTLKIELDLELPQSLNKERVGRDEKFVNCPVSTFVTLYSGIRRIDFRTFFMNNAKDHRLRVLFPTNVKTDYCFTEGQFDVLKRMAGFPQNENSVEWACSAYPQQHFLNVADGKAGLTLVNRGLPEYEAIPGNNGITIALTLLRCVGWLSRDDFLTRQGYNAGPSIMTPEAQCLGRQEFFYSLIMHQGDWQADKVWKAAYNYNVDLLTKQASRHKGFLPQELSFLKIIPETLMVSAVKKAEEKERLVLRVFSFEPETQAVEIKLGRKIKRAYLLNLNEEKSHRLEVAENIVSFPIKPRQIITIGIEF